MSLPPAERWELGERRLPKRFFTFWSEDAKYPSAHVALRLTAHKCSANAVRPGEIFRGLLPKGLIHETPVTH